MVKDTAERRRAIKGLDDRIEWLSNNDRPNREVAKTIQLFRDLLEKYSAEDAMDLFYADLARGLAKLKK